MRQIGAFEAKTNFSQLLKDVQQGETISITRNGEPVALLVPVKPSPRDIPLLLQDFYKWREGISWSNDISTTKAKEQGRK